MSEDNWEAFARDGELSAVTRGQGSPSPLLRLSCTFVQRCA